MELKGFASHPLCKTHRKAPSLTTAPASPLPWQLVAPFSPLSSSAAVLIGGPISSPLSCHTAPLGVTVRSPGSWLMITCTDTALPQCTGTMERPPQPHDGQLKGCRAAASVRCMSLPSKGATAGVLSFSQDPEKDPQSHSLEGVSGQGEGIHRATS